MKKHVNDRAKREGIGQVAPCPRKTFTLEPGVDCELPKLRRADYTAGDVPRSGFLDMGDKLREGAMLRVQLENECKRLMVTEFGTFNGLHLVHNFPYSSSPHINIKRPAVPRFMFAKTAPTPPDKEGNYDDLCTVWRYDYGSGTGTGSVATNESSRLIGDFTSNLDSLCEEVWKSMKDDPRFKSLTRYPANKFNHVTVLLYRGHNDLSLHADQVWTQDGKFDSVRNSQKKGTAVAIVTVGSDRVLQFHKRYSEGKTWMKAEAKPFMKVTQKHMQVHLGHPDDERPKRRHDSCGIRHDHLQFLHRVAKPPSHLREGYFSMAYVLRCVVAVAPVNICDNHVRVDNRTIRNLQKKTTKERIRKRKRCQEKALKNPNSLERNLIKEYQEFLREKAKELFCKKQRRL